MERSHAKAVVGETMNEANDGVCLLHHVVTSISKDWPQSAMPFSKAISSMS